MDKVQDSRHTQCIYHDVDYEKWIILKKKTMLNATSTMNMIYGLLFAAGQSEGLLTSQTKLCHNNKVCVWRLIVCVKGVLKNVRKHD